jgi:hypothetical protein
MNLKITPEKSDLFIMILTSTAEQNGKNRSIRSKTKNVSCIIQKTFPYKLNTISKLKRSYVLSQLRFKVRSFIIVNNVAFS